MKSRFKFDTVARFEVSWGLYVVRVSTLYAGKEYQASAALTLEQIELASFDIIGETIRKLEDAMEIHLAKISSS